MDEDNETEIGLERPINRRPRVLDTIVYGGLAIGVLDLIDASTFFPLYYGISFARVWQGVAAGVLGREAAVAGGWSTAALGIVLHFVVAICIAAVYYLASRNLTIMLRHPVISGMTFGVIAHFVMQWVVIPLSAIGASTNAQPLAVMLNGIIGHAFLVGLPVALIAGWSAKRKL
jgi:hypothetical protein